MIHDTFYNLNEVKKRKILNAIKEEILEMGFDNAKVTHICKRASIPRSAFYRYFDALEDSLEALIKANQNEIRPAYNQLSDELDGDLFEVTKKMLVNLLNNDVQYLLFQAVSNNPYAKTAFLKQALGKYRALDAMGLEEKNQLLLRISIRIITQLIFEYRELKRTKEETIHEYDLIIRMLKQGYLNYET
ncbi:TetR/AcrR family transcriptional regulator [Haloplasma contractile]|uniref:Transcriptional regulator TetR-AcrR family protein n=1 Tax=Haloplasma contractile SSD-17B TaxID=1033810 RepID=F7PUU8_9MOLU|nr:TetR/AcrR family transcriptional regulator [Haloplasma contractile]ERJ11038.1 Transcriptional regulator TetR-AcrR family protein [Haloplasma contractile SSD-17B]